MAEKLARSIESDKFGDVPEVYHHLYVERDGRHVLNIEIEGTAEVSKVNEFRETNTALAQQIENLQAKFKDIDPDEYKALKEKAENSPGKESIIDNTRISRLEEKLATMQADHAKQLSQKDELIADLKQAKERASHADELRKLAVARMDPAAIGDAVREGSRAFRYDSDGKTPVAFDEDGHRIYRNGELVTYNDWLDDYIAARPYVVLPSSGGGAQHQQRNGAAPGAELMKLPATERLAKMRQASPG